MHLKTADFQISRMRASCVGGMDKLISALNSRLIEGWRKHQFEERRKLVTINRKLQGLQGVLSKAVEWNVLQQHPFSGIKPLKTDRAGRVRDLSAGMRRRVCSKPCCSVRRAFGRFASGSIDGSRCTINCNHANMSGRMLKTRM